MNYWLYEFCFIEGDVLKSGEYILVRERKESVVEITAKARAQRKLRNDCEDDIPTDRKRKIQ